MDFNLLIREQNSKDETSKMFSMPCFMIPHNNNFPGDHSLSSSMGSCKKKRASAHDTEGNKNEEKAKARPTGAVVASHVYFTCGLDFLSFRTAQAWKPFRSYWSGFPCYASFRDQRRYRSTTLGNGGANGRGSWAHGANSHLPRAAVTCRCASTVHESGLSGIASFSGQVETRGRRSGREEHVIGHSQAMFWETMEDVMLLWSQLQDTL